MVFSDTSTKLGIVQEIDDLCDSDASSYPVATKTRRVNTALEEIEAKLIVASANGWEFGDSNFTSLPTGLKTLVNSQETYQLSGDQIPSTGTGIDVTNPILTLKGASVKDVNGIWRKLDPIHLSDIFKRGFDPAEYFKTDGLPQYYEKREDFLVLYPAPDNGVSVTLINGLKVFYDRRASKFTASDTTKEPGFASPYHSILAYMAAIPYCVSYKKDRVPAYLNEITRLEKELLAFYGARAKDEPKVMTMRGIQFR